MKSKSISLASLLHAFFHEWMGKQKNLSRHTVYSYRDTWKLFLRFVAGGEEPYRRRRRIRWNMEGPRFGPFCFSGFGVQND
jgi:hypothetical protein